MIRIFTFLTTLCFISLTSCGQQKNKNSEKDSLNKAWDQTIPGNFSRKSAQAFDSGEVRLFLSRYSQIGSDSNEVKDFYSQRSYAFAWFDKGVLIEQAGNLANRVKNLKNDGIYKTIFYPKQLDSLLHGDSDRSAPNVELEIMLTTQYFAFSKLAFQGMNSSVSKAAKWYLPRKIVSYDQYLDSLTSAPGNSSLVAEPVYRQYELLRFFLKKYQALNAGMDWPVIKMGKTVATIGDTSPVTLLLKRRLFKLEDFHGDTLSNAFDKDLVEGLKQFQYRHGLVIDGVPGKQTIAEINVPLKTRIRQIIVNMERSRWLPVQLDKDYLAVNIPEFQLHVYHADSLLWSCNVVVGKELHPTTLFYGEIKFVVFSPYWNVPPGIMRHEILPGMKKDPQYLAKHNMEITGYAGGLPVIRQKPGNLNSLGLVKFLFPNSYNIYLHDTPAKFLFGETSRAFSHGCIRVMKPAKLAGFLLKNNNEWDPEKINRAMHAGKERYVSLNSTVPVFIAYFTAFTDRNDRINFRKDIYGLDEHLASMLMSE